MIACRMLEIKSDKPIKSEITRFHVSNYAPTTEMPVINQSTSVYRAGVWCARRKCVAL